MTWRRVTQEEAYQQALEAAVDTRTAELRQQVRDLTAQVERLREEVKATESWHLNQRDIREAELRARLAAQAEEIERLTTAREVAHEVEADVIRQLQAAEAEIARLREALRTYGQHTAECAKVPKLLDHGAGLEINFDAVCTCGYE